MDGWVGGWVNTYIHKQTHTSRAPSAAFSCAAFSSSSFFVSSGDFGAVVDGDASIILDALCDTIRYTMLSCVASLALSCFFFCGCTKLYDRLRQIACAVGLSASGTYVKVEVQPSLFRFRCLGGGVLGLDRFGVFTRRFSLGHLIHNKLTNECSTSQILLNSSARLLKTHPIQINHVELETSSPNPTKAALDSDFPVKCHSDS